MSKKGRGKSGETLEKAAELLMSLFRVCASDKYVSLTIISCADIAAVCEINI